MSKPLVLLSGGIDSATCLAISLASNPHCVAFDYGQGHRTELTYARDIARFYDVGLTEVSLPNLTKVDDVVVAARNLIFVSLAAAMASGFGCDHLVVGCNKSDWGRFPDCRPTFWTPVGDVLRNTYGITLHLPLLYLTKSEVVAKARRIGVPLSRTWSCYSPRADETPCAECLACKTRSDAGA